MERKGEAGAEDGEEERGEDKNTKRPKQAIRAVILPRRTCARAATASSGERRTNSYHIPSHAR